MENEWSRYLSLSVIKVDLLTPELMFIFLRDGVLILYVISGLNPYESTFKKSLDIDGKRYHYYDLRSVSPEKYGN